MKLKTRKIDLPVIYLEPQSNIFNDIITISGTTSADQKMSAQIESLLSIYSQYNGMPHDDTEKALNYLEFRLESLKKNLHYAETIHIVDSIQDETTAISKINSLANNTALIVNIGSFNYNDEVYGLGDVVLRDYNGNLLHIANESSGFYYPKSVETNGGDTILTYGFGIGVPKAGTQTISSGSQLQEPYQNIKVPVTIPSDGIIYGETDILTDHTIITGEYIDGDLVKPIVYYYLQRDNDYHERIVFSDEDYKINGSDIELVSCPSVLTDKVLYVVK